MPRARPILIWLAASLAMGDAGSAGAVSEGRARELERLVRQDCGSCHGMTLKGGLGPDIRTERFTGVPVEAIAQIILEGIPGTPMPPWRPLLTEEDAAWIARYLSGGIN